MGLFIIIFFWMPLCVAVAVYAEGRGRSAFGWFVGSLIFSPLLCFLFVAAFQDLAVLEKEEM